MTFIASLLSPYSVGIGFFVFPLSSLLGKHRMVSLAAEIDPQVKQASGRTHDYTERASNEEDHGEHKTLYAQGKRQTSSPK
jgi:hypothetical protein